MRYFYSVCFLVIGTGLPVSAKNTGADYPTPSASSKAGTKVIPESRSLAAQAKEQSHKESEVILTPDVSRSACPSLVSKQESSASLAAKQPKRSELKESHSEKEASAGTTKKPFFEICPQGLPSRTDVVPASASAPARTEAVAGRLARVTAYWAAEGDYYTERCISATGVHLHDGHCAVDPSIIPYGSVVEIAGVGKFLAVDTGSAVISRTAAREGGHTSEERNAIVVDLFFEDRSEGEKFAACAAKYVSISWWTPTSMGTAAKAARGLFAEEDWSKIQSKQL